MRNTLIIVGAGFSGTVLAANLLRRPPPDGSDIVLIERGPVMGRGVAYAERDFPYLLNVPAARLSADSRDPLQFLRFAQRRLAAAGGEDFLPRALYGDYLQEVLLQAGANAPPSTRLVQVFGEVRNITPQGTGKPWVAELADGKPMPADRVILALGNPPPPELPWAAAVRDHPGYRNDPWDLPKHLTAKHSVLIVGNGLTMADVVMTLTRNARAASMAGTAPTAGAASMAGAAPAAGGMPALHTVSRHGLVPLSQTEFRPSAMRGNGEVLLAHANSVRRIVAVARELSREVQARGGDWREVVTFIRNLAPALWRRLPDGERRRFVRHLQAHWDVHRHRLPPQWSERLASLRRDGKLQVNAGRIRALTAEGDRLRVEWHARGGGSRVLKVDLVVNATGPDYALRRSANPLLQALRTAGLVSEDALGLGLRTAEYGACIDAEGTARRRLYYLGPMLRADHWEATAATELRNHAERLAAHLAGADR
jgi:uncharacterized NAD(P)/FAD-binding protein YdhS